MNSTRDHDVRFHLIASALFACLLTACGNRGSDRDFDKQLRLHLEKGHTFTLVQNIFTQTSMTVDGTELSVHENGEMAYEFHVDSIDEDYNVNATVTIKVAKLDTSLRELGRRLPGKTFAITLAPTGKVLEVNGMDEIVAELEPDLGLPDWTEQAGIESSSEQRKIQNDILDFWSDEALRDSFNMMLCPFPLKTVVLGDRWDPEPQPFFGADIFNRPSYVVEELHKGSVILAYTSEIISTEGSEKSFVSGEGLGRFTVDKSRGFIREAEMKYVYSGSVLTQGDSADGKRSPTTYEATIILETLNLF